VPFGKLGYTLWHKRPLKFQNGAGNVDQWSISMDSTSKILEGLLRLHEMHA